MNNYQTRQFNRITIILMIIKMFSIISFSVGYSTFILYMTKKLGLRDKDAVILVSSFLAYLFILRVIAGHLGGRLISYRSLMLIGLGAITLSFALLSIPTLTALYLGLTAFTVGNALLVAIHCLLTAVYQHDDIKREGAFLWNYSIMNVGYLLGYTLSGYYQLSNNYHQLFIWCSAFSFMAMLITLLNWRSLGVNLITQSSPARKKLQGVLIFFIFAFLFIIVWFALHYAVLSNMFLLLLGLGITTITIIVGFKQINPAIKKKIWASLILGFLTLIFWTIYNLTPILTMLFIERNVNNHFFGLVITPQWLQNVNALTIMLGGPLLYVLFNYLRKRGVEVSVPRQFSCALLLLGFAFLILFMGISFADAQGLSHPIWIIISFILQSLGELFIAPIGFAMIAKITRLSLQGTLMGIWMMLIGIGAILSGYISQIILDANHSFNPVITNPAFSYAFCLLGSVAVILGIITFLSASVLTIRQ